MQCEQSAYFFILKYLLLAILFSGLLVAERSNAQIPTADTTSVQQSNAQPPGGVSQRPGSAQASREATDGSVNFSSRDSLVFQIRGERRGVLYGAANVTQGTNQLSAGQISLLLDINEVHAQTDTPEDSLSHPVLKREEQELRSTRILFNYETEKGKFDAAQVRIQEGHLTGNKVKNISRSEVFIEQGKYSTCPPTHMYYYLQADRMKVVDEEEIFFTNARLYILDIPYPIIFPFGYVPSGIEQRESGMLEPTYAYQNTTRRGLGLQNLGWFQYFNDYITGQTSFDVYTSGSFFNETQMQYRVTDQFDGGITIGYSNERGLEPTDPDFSETVSKRISIRHNQQFSPYANLSANINLNTSDYFRRNSYDIDERAQTSSSSSISYRYRHPENTYNFNVSTRLNQQYSTNTTRLSGPEASFSLRQLTPFENTSGSTQQSRWYETISIGYSNNFKSEYQFRPIDQDSASVNWLDALMDPTLHREATGEDEHIQLGLRHQGQISVSRLVPSQFLNVSANASLNEYWYPSSIRKNFNEEENEVETERIQGITTGRDFTTSLNFSTTLYGISQMKIGSLEGFRHTLRPSIGFSYRPDFSDDMWGYYREVQTDTTGRSQRYSIFEDGVYGGPGRGEQQNINFNLNNIFETKQVKRDSTGEVQSENLRIIDNFSISTNYNLAADSLNFGQVRASLSSRVIENLSINMSASYSFYARGENGREINRFIWQESGKFLQPLNYSVSLSSQFRGGGRGGMGQVRTPVYQPYDPLDQAFFSPVDSRFNQVPVQDFSSTWRFGLNFSYQWRSRPGRSAQQSAVLNVNNIQFNLTPKWSFNTRLGYDFIGQELTPSQFALNRQMECWTLSFQFNPFGDFQYYFFRLRINSGQIQSIFQKLPLLNNLERSSSPSGRSPRF
ncbi:MAG: putative LPS assembly protein LptD [Balneolaceae bacterium]